jgi:hypothetical protein
MVGSWFNAVSLLVFLGKLFLNFILMTLEKKNILAHKISLNSIKSPIYRWSHEPSNLVTCFLILLTIQHNSHYKFILFMMDFFPVFMKWFFCLASPHFFCYLKIIFPSMGAENSLCGAGVKIKQQKKTHIV